MSPEDGLDVLEDPPQAAQVLGSACRIDDEDVVVTRRDLTSGPCATVLIRAQPRANDAADRGASAGS